MTCIAPPWDRCDNGKIRPQIGDKVLLKTIDNRIICGIVQSSTGVEYIDYISEDGAGHWCWPWQIKEIA